MLLPPLSLALFAFLAQSVSCLSLSLALSVQANGTNSSSLLPFEVTQNSDTPALRAAGIDTKRAAFLYGPPVAGGPSYPIGPLALTKKTADLAAVQVDEAPQLTGATVDGADATLGIAEVGDSSLAW